MADVEAAWKMFGGGCHFGEIISLDTSKWTGWLTNYNVKVLFGRGLLVQNTFHGVIEHVTK